MVWMWMNSRHLSNCNVHRRGVKFLQLYLYQISQRFLLWIGCKSIFVTSGNYPPFYLRSMPGWWGSSLRCFCFGRWRDRKRPHSFSFTFFGALSCIDIIGAAVRHIAHKTSLVDWSAEVEAGGVAHEQKFCLICSNSSTNIKSLEERYSVLERVRSCNEPCPSLVIQLHERLGWVDREYIRCWIAQIYLECELESSD